MSAPPQDKVRNTREAQVLEHGGHVFLVAADATQSFGQYHTKTSCLGAREQSLNAGTGHRWAGGSLIGVSFHHGLALARRTLAALARLVPAPHATLVFGEIAGVGGDTGHAGWPFL
jgi:hypothetical protein